jgi:hypothetical protein
MPDEQGGRRRGVTCAIVVLIALCLCAAISAIILYTNGDYIIAWLDYYFSQMGAP